MSLVSGRFSADASVAELTAVLRDVSFLEEAHESDRAELAGLASCRTYPKGNILYFYGEPSDAICIVLSGRVKVTLMSDEGREVVLATMERSGVFGLVEALDGGPRAGTAVTLTACRVAKISPERFLPWLREHPLVHQKLLILFAQMVRQAYEKVGEQALLTVKRRLYATLLEIARAGGERQGQDVVFERPTHRELADQIGSSRVVISRILKELLADDDLEMDGRVVRLPFSALVTRNDF